MKNYRIIIGHEDRNILGKSHYHITKEGAEIIWKAYTNLFGEYGQTMDRREERGGVCWLQEIDLFKKEGVLIDSFDWKDYEVEDRTGE
ncbi:MAG TPA: hypothetical protein ENH82_10955 [bacterium]|nr:hypothetical protein [bacterium]